MPGESAFHDVVTEALIALPEGINVIILSRTEPPSKLARLSASDRLSQMDWQALRLTIEETRAITLLRNPIDEDTLSLLHKQSDGWAAGLTLMLERLKRDDLPPESVGVETREAVFNYFAGEIFDKASPENQQILLSTALLSRVTVPIAEKLSLQPGAGKLLDFLYRRHLFTDRRLGVEPTYHYHDLFRAFLVARAQAFYAPAGLAQLSARAAKLLEESGNTEDAISLYFGAGDWRNGIRSLLNHAPAWIAQGRGQTLREWIAKIPVSELVSAPWLDYWRGISLIASRPSDAKQWLQTASAPFEKSNDKLGQALCAAAMIHAIYLEWSDFTEMDPWIDRLKNLLDADLQFPRAEAEMQVYAGAMIATFNRRPADSLLAVSADRVFQLLTRPMDSNIKVAAATALLFYYISCPGGGRGAEVIDLVSSTLESGLVSLLNQMYWYVRSGVYLGNQQRFDEAVARIERGEALARDRGIGFRSAIAFAPRMAVMGMLANIEGSALGFEYMEKAADTTKRLDVGVLLYGRAGLSGITGDFCKAVAYAIEARPHFDEGGMFFSKITEVAPEIRTGG